MNLYLRLLKLILRLLLQGSPPPAVRSSRLSFRVWPWDCDINLHLTNSRYLSFMDLGRTHLIHQSGVMGLLLKRRWLPVAQAVHMTFIRPINPFQSFELISELVFWDERYWYITQRFEVNGRTCAIGLVRGVLLDSEKRVVPLNRIFETAGVTLIPPPPSPLIEAWINMLQTQRRAATTQTQSSVQ